MSMNARKTLKIYDRKGASAIEFALVLPVLVLLLFGIIEFSIILFDKAVITNASREGARAGIVFADPRPTDAQISAVVNTYCSDHLITFGSASPVTTFPIRGSSSGDTLSVRVLYQYDFLVLPNFISSLTGGINLAAETVMRME